MRNVSWATGGGAVGQPEAVLERGHPRGVFRGLAALKDERAIPMPLDTTAYGCPLQARSAAMHALGKLGGEKDLAPEATKRRLAEVIDWVEDTINSGGTYGGLPKSLSRVTKGRVCS